MRLLRVLRAVGVVVAFAGGAATGQPGNQPEYDIGIGGTATIVGAVGGSVIADPNLLNLTVTVSFGEVSPVNQNALVRVTVPVIIRSEGPYELVASIPSTTLGTSPQSVRLSDIGIGIINMRSLARGENCAAPHTIYPPYNADPAATVTRTPRATYPGNLSLIGGAGTVLMSGPILSSRQFKLNRNQIPGNQRENGWAFELVLTIAPQFFVPGESSVTLLLTLRPGPPAACP